MITPLNDPMLAYIAKRIDELVVDLKELRVEQRTSNRALEQRVTALETTAAKLDTKLAFIGSIAGIVAGGAVSLAVKMIA